MLYILYHILHIYATKNFSPLFKFPSKRYTILSHAQKIHENLKHRNQL